MPSLSAGSSRIYEQYAGIGVSCHLENMTVTVDHHIYIMLLYKRTYSL